MLDDLWSNPWAYLPPKSSLWLWIGGPLIILITYFLTMHTSAERKRRLREAEIWRASLTPAGGPRQDNKKGQPYRPDPAKSKDEPPPKKKDSGPPRVLAIPPTLHGALAALGGGDAILHFELVRGLAYLSLMESNVTAGSDYQAVTGKLEARGPSMVVRPLPLVDGARVANTGVQFKKDPELMALFLVEGADAKAIGKWLSTPIRRALCDLPAAWLRVEGATMTVSVFGVLEADKIDALVELADTIFAEHGADGGPSLFADDAERPAPVSAPVASKKPPRVEPTTATTLADSPGAKKKG